MGMGFAPTWLRQVSPPPASQNHFNHCLQWPNWHCHGNTCGMCVFLPRVSLARNP